MISRLVKWILGISVLLLVFMTLMRIGFYLNFKTAEYSFNNTQGSFILGLRYDLRTIAIIILPLFVISGFHLRSKGNGRISIGSVLRIFLSFLIYATIILALRNNKAGTEIILLATLLFVLILFWVYKRRSCNPFHNSVSGRIWKIYLVVVVLILVFFYAADLQHYDYLHQRLNASVLNYLQDAGISLTMAWETYPVIKLLLAIFVVVLILSWIINKFYKRLEYKINTTNKAGRIITGTVFFLLLVIGIFGRIGQYPLRWSDAFSFGDEFKASLSLNPVQSFFSSLQYRHSAYDEKKVKQYYPLLSAYLGVARPDSSSLNYERDYSFPPDSTRRPNVILVICESFSGYKSSMWGNPLNTTPYFNNLCNNGIFFDHCFTPAYGTARGVWAVVTGIPDVETANTASRNPAAVDQHSVINDLQGYQKFYFLGGSTSWANIRGLLTNNISNLHLYEEGSYKEKAIDVWGISDKHLFLEANNVLRQQTSPFFAIIQTSDNHRPYTIPSEDKTAFKLVNYSADTLHKYGFESNEELNSFRYTDFCYQQFMEAAKKEHYNDNTIFVFVGDHGIRGNPGEMFPKCWNDLGLTTQHVPLLFYSPSLLKPQRIANVCSQIDILPSIAYLLKTPFITKTMGRVLFDSIHSNHLPIEDRAFLFDPDYKKIGLMTDSFCYRKDLLTGKDEFLSSQNNMPLSNDSTTLANEKIIRELTSSYFETAKYMMLNNKKQNKK